MRNEGKEEEEKYRSPSSPPCEKIINHAIRLLEALTLSDLHIDLLILVLKFSENEWSESEDFNLHAVFLASGILSC